MSSERVDGMDVQQTSKAEQGRQRKPDKTRRLSERAKGRCWLLIFLLYECFVFVFFQCAATQETSASLAPPRSFSLSSCVPSCFFPSAPSPLFPFLLFFPPLPLTRAATHRQTNKSTASAQPPVATKTPRDKGGKPAAHTEKKDAHTKPHTCGHRGQKTPLSAHACAVSVSCRYSPLIVFYRPVSPSVSFYFLSQASPRKTKWAVVTAGGGIMGERASRSTHTVHAPSSLAPHPPLQPTDPRRHAPFMFDRCNCTEKRESALSLLAIFVVLARSLVLL